MLKKQSLFFLILIFSIAAKAQTKLPLTLESIWNGFFDEKKLQPHILNTKPAVAFIRADKETNFEGILTLDMVTGKIIDTIFTNQTKVEGDETPTTFAFFEDFEFSPDDSKILIKTERQSIYHQSFKEFVYIWNDVKKTLRPVSTDGKISCAGFAPKGDYLAFVRDANLYLRNLQTDKVTAVTSDGSPGSIINAMADEVYEDGFGLHKMYEWSPAGDKIAFIKINQGFVKKVPIAFYEKNETTIGQQVYAKPGESISEAQIYIYDIKNNSFTKMELGANANQYITNFKWQPNGASLFIERLNRSQKKIDILQCNATNGSFVKTILSEEKPDYVKVNSNVNNLYMHPVHTSFFWLSESNGYNHIYEVDYITNKSTAITKGKWEVNTIEAYNDKEDKLFFTANKNEVTQNQLFVTDTKEQKIVKVTETNGWHSVWLSKDYTYFFDKVNTLNSPSVYKIFKTTGKEITNKAIIENKRFQDNIKPYDLNTCKPFTYKNNIGEDINGWMINGDYTEGAKRKPLLLYVYGGNNKQEVVNEWNDRMAMTFRYFANKGYTIACIDPSGTPGRGEQFRKLTYNNLTNQVMDDIIEAKNFLVRNNKVDDKNTALMGWSYGGYLTALMATKYAGAFSKYIAIAPVTNWRNYAAPFTERIIGMPSDNPELYKTLMPEEYISNYKGGLLLIHGSADDNVHVQHSLKLAKALTDSDAYYDIQIFSDKGHILSDGASDKTRMNLFRKIYKFLERQEKN
jgi:dipeptidyl-peptidase 4